MIVIIVIMNVVIIDILSFYYQYYQHTLCTHIFREVKEKMLGDRRQQSRDLTLRERERCVYIEKEGSEGGKERETQGEEERRDTAEILSFPLTTLDPFGDNKPQNQTRSNSRLFGESHCPTSDTQHYVAWE